jgi:hypothetical protein
MRIAKSDRTVHLNQHWPSIVESESSFEMNFNILLSFIQPIFWISRICLGILDCVTDMVI